MLLANNTPRILLIFSWVVQSIRTKGQFRFLISVICVHLWQIILALQQLLLIVSHELKFLRGLPHSGFRVSSRELET